MTVGIGRDVSKRDVWQLIIACPELTFILLEARAELSAAHGSPESSRGLKMIGDVNLFLPDGPSGDIECEVMIAGTSGRLCSLAGCHASQTPGC